MEDNNKLIESLLKRITDYGKVSYELAKLQALEKISVVASSIIFNAIVFVLFASFMLFLSLGAAYWLGEILGNNYYGFFVVAAFYIVVAIFVRLFMYKWLKKLIRNYVINQVLN